MFGDWNAIAANANVPSPDPGTVGEPDWSPGEPEGVEYDDDVEIGEVRSLPFPSPSPWSGWPAEWATPNWGKGGPLDLNRLVDIAWAAIDLNSSVLSTMPVYRTQSGQVIAPKNWMTNPDPLVYSSWQEFANQLFWDYQLGEAFVLPTTWFADGSPRNFRVVPPWLINVEMKAGRRVYTLGREDVTADILHIRYRSNTVTGRGISPLECAGGRMVMARLLQRYAAQMIETGGVPHYWITTEKPVTITQGREMLQSWVDSRTQHPGHPAFLGNGGRLEQSETMNAKDMTLLEISQATEARIAILCGVPPFLLGLPSGGDSLTYSNVSQVFDFHDRSSLRPKASAVMSSLSLWALPLGQTAELNRDEYSRPTFKERVEAYEKLASIVDAEGRSAISVDEIRAMERLRGPASATSLTGGTPGDEERKRWGE